MDAIKLLEEDHKLVKKLFREYEALPNGQPDRKRALAERIIRELMVHERIEEEIFYPAFRTRADKEGKELLAEAKEEHHVVDLILDELQAVDIKAEDFDAKFKVLQENVEHHIKEEEEEMFPDAAKRLKPRLDALGEEMGQYKEELTRQVAPRGSAKPVEPERKRSR